MTRFPITSFLPRHPAHSHPGRLPAQKVWSCTVNDDRSLNIRVTADPDGLYNLIRFKLFNDQISRIDIDSDSDSESSQLRKEFKVAFESMLEANKFSQLRVRIEPLTYTWLTWLNKFFTTL